MVWSLESCSRDCGAEDSALHTQPCLPPSSSLQLDPAVASKRLEVEESNTLISSFEAPFNENLETSNNPTAISQYLTNISTEISTNENANFPISQYNVDNLTYKEIESWTMKNPTAPVFDTVDANVNQNEIKDEMKVSVHENDDGGGVRDPGIRKDSLDSLYTVDSTSPGEIFNTEYTDTVSSIESTSFLLKPCPDSDEEMPAVAAFQPPEQTNYYNDACMSCSSSEGLNEAESLEGVYKIENCIQEPETTTGALLEVRVEDPSTTNLNERVVEVDLLSKDEKAHKADDFVTHPLIPINENEVVTFKVEEVEPTEYVKITNNIISVDESFLFHSNQSLWDLHISKKDAKATTMHNLHERLSFQDLTDVSKIGKACQKALLYIKDDINFGSIASLNSIASKQIDKNSCHQSISLISGDTKEVDIIKSNKHTRNLLALSFCLTLLYIAIGSVRNLQSSINHEGGVGVLSMATNSLGYLVGSLFSTSIVLNFQPRKCIIVNLAPNLLYVAANIYPTLWLMIPISFIQGLSMAVIWNAVSTYVTFLSRGKTQKSGEATNQVSSRFFGILCLMYQSHLIIGNLIASLVLMPGDAGNAANETSSDLAANLTDLITANVTKAAAAAVAQIVDVTGTGTPKYTDSVVIASGSLVKVGEGASTSNASVMDEVVSSSLCGAKFCQLDSQGSGFAVSDETKYLLFGTYMGCIVISLFIAVFLMEPLNPRLFMSSVRPLQKLKSNLSSLVCFFADVKFLLLLPLLMYSVIQFGFVTAEFTKAFVTCSLGIHMVGYTMICFGICGAVSSYVGGLLTRFTGRIPLFVFAGFSNLALLIYMKQWQPTPDSLTPFFVIMGVWGASDGIWISQVSSLMGIIFPEKYEEAYAGLRIAQGLGPAITFGYSSSVCMEIKIYVTIALCVLSMVLYLLMESLLRRKERKGVYKFKQTSV